MWAAEQPEGVVGSSPCKQQRLRFISGRPPMALGRLPAAWCLPSELFSDCSPWFSPQRARWVSMGRTAASAASAKTVARVTPPRGSALAPKAGRGWPASWVSTGASAAPRNGASGANLSRFGLIFLGRQAARSSPARVRGGGGSGAAFHPVPPPRVRAGTARGGLPAALRVPSRGALRPPEGPLRLSAWLDGREVREP